MFKLKASRQTLVLMSADIQQTPAEIEKKDELDKEIPQALEMISSVALSLANVYLLRYSRNILINRFSVDSQRDMCEDQW